MRVLLSPQLQCNGPTLLPTPSYTATRMPHVWQQVHSQLYPCLLVNLDCVFAWIHEDRWQQQRASSISLARFMGMLNYANCTVRADFWESETQGAIFVRSVPDIITTSHTGM